MTAKTASLTEILFDDGYKGDVDPFEVFTEWLEAARESEINDPNAMTLATVDETDMPDARTVLLNGRDTRGFVFYTNFGSAKGRELRTHPKAALLFHWKSQRRQIRIRGPVETVSDAEADAYFATRPIQSRIGAHASDQSRPLESRQVLFDKVEALKTEFGEDVPRPDYWSGFRVKPLEIEFWKDGAFRLHDRVVFRREGLDAPWTRSRLYP
ncbi:pyridoxamine 5'-phosphate oxidase [Pelagibacterium xiamenense]|uniref:pyridoxamine 5'-phosphate oxidase n=1 Tax=Pelagibacterium xiamenense TaxID=2901140 RepID=UPI001E4F80D6|nr:pyridoxamine 5'-phosphate oxidase [Pelagibacterium xiamenense]MCD7059346.1 pyridoxamine 5'-phosphate oxidase [Pelagibacterium xiamenense]